MTAHHTVVHLFAEGIYFAPPGTPWLRGTNENSNGYFAKGTDPAVHSPEELRRVESPLNNRPREVRDGRTPLQAHHDLLAR